MHAARCLSLRRWQYLDGLRATDWLKTWLGEKGYALLWQKFLHISSRVQRQPFSGLDLEPHPPSRQLCCWLKETLGYLEGGSR